VTVAPIPGFLHVDAIEAEAIQRRAVMQGKLAAAQADLASAMAERKKLVDGAADGEAIAPGESRRVDDAIRDAEAAVGILRDALPRLESRIKVAAEAVDSLLYQEAVRLFDEADARRADAEQAVQAAQEVLKAARGVAFDAQHWAQVSRGNRPSPLRDVWADRIEATRATGKVQPILHAVPATRRRA
jgi:hypothetical protein